jgi:hypothetical protein
MVRQEACAIAGPPVWLDVFPVHPTDAQVETNWFVTSREGAHPRLSYLVRAGEPHFLMVLVPRRESLPRPQVEALKGEGGFGVEVKWPQATDRCLFAREAATMGGTEVMASAAFIRTRDGQVDAWGLFDGRRLSQDGRTFFEAERDTIEVSKRPR